METWKDAQQFEKDWWGTCCNVLGEELKQLVYAEKMGIEFEKREGIPYIIDLHGKSVADIGGGPNSLLLKMVNGQGTVVDPCDYPKWVEERYWMANIEHFKIPGEEFEGTAKMYDEVWIYNCLQHTIDPEKIIQNAKNMGKVVRIFEWIDSEQNEMHPHVLTEENLNKWLGTKGTVETLNGINECYGKCYYAKI